MGGCIRYELKIIGWVFVVGSDIECDYLLKEMFWDWVKREECVVVDVEEFVLRRVGVVLGVEFWLGECCIEVEKGVELFFYVVVLGVMDGFGEGDFFEGVIVNIGSFFGSFFVCFVYFGSVRFIWVVISYGLFFELFD